MLSFSVTVLYKSLFELRGPNALKNKIKWSCYQTTHEYIYRLAKIGTLQSFYMENWGRYISAKWFGLIGERNK